MAANLILPAGSAAAAGSTPDPVTRSLRLASGSSTGDSSSHLDRNSIGTPTDGTKWTFSAWIKRSELTNNDGIFAGGTSSANYSVFRFRSSAGTEDNLFYDDKSDGSNNYQWRWTPKFRDPSAFFNLMLVYDASQSAQVDKLKLYINGVLASSASVDGGNPASSHTMSVSKSGMNQIIGNNSINDAKANLLIADAYFLDGVAKTVTGGVTDFTESNGYGGLKPKEYTGSDFGNSGFHLLFENTSAIGEDSTSNSNDFMPTNISSHDVMLDTPTKNYCTLNPLDKHSNISLEQGNLKTSDSVTGGNNYDGIRGTIGLPKTGQWYWECRLSTESYITALGIADGSGDIQGSQNAPSKRNFLGVGSWFRIYNSDTPKHMVNQDGTSGSDWSQASNPSQSGGSIYMVAVDMDNGTAWWGKDGSWFANSSGTTANPASNAGAQATGLNDGTTWFPFSQQGDQTAEAAMAFNFGADNTFAGAVTSGQDTSQSEFFYAPPTGFKSLNTSNLAAPSIKPAENFAAAIYEGNNGDEEINLGFTPDLTWIKNRDDDDTYHGLYDSVRGLSEGAIHIQETGAEEGVQRVASFDSDTGSEGFTLASSNYTFTNASGKDYISWNWKAHQTPPTPTNYSTTLTFLVKDLEGNGNSAWGTTKFEVFEGSISLGTISCPTTYDSYNSEYRETWSIKTNDASKIKVVWKDVDTSSLSGSNRLWYVYALFENGSTQEEIWDPNNTGWDGSNPTPSNGDVFRAQTNSADESTTGVLEVQGPTVDPNSEKYNAAAGFTMFTYTGNSSTNNDTMLFNHSLGAPIDFAIGKCRDTPASGTSGGKWVVWHKDLSYDYYSLYLNESESENDVGGNNYDSSGSSVGWFANASTGSQHHVKIRNVEIYDGNNYDTVRMVDNSKDFVFYGFTGVESYSKFGSYTGTGSATSPPFIYTGFEIGWLLTKNIDNGSVHWNLHDAARNPHNVVDERVWPNLSYASDSNYDKFDFYSNGFRPVTGDAGHNGNGNTIIYAAFAESPFKYANAR